VLIHTILIESLVGGAYRGMGTNWVKYFSW